MGHFVCSTMATVSLLTAINKSPRMVDGQGSRIWIGPSIKIPGLLGEALCICVCPKMVVVVVKPTSNSPLAIPRRRYGTWP